MTAYRTEPVDTPADGNIIWHYGTAEMFPGYQDDHRAGWIAVGGDPDELHCRYDEPSSWGGKYGHMAPHIIERIEP